jgi:hypothetical protein
MFDKFVLLQCTSLDARFMGAGREIGEWSLSLVIPPKEQNGNTARGLRNLGLAMKEGSGCR